MSQFLSRKLLKYRGLVQEGTIEHDLECPSCGYNLRGLPVGRNCPECGQARFPAGETASGYESHPLHDAILSGDPAERDRWRVGLGLASCCIPAVVLATVLYFFSGGISAGQAVSLAYVMACLLISIAWLIAVWMTTPASLDAHWPWMRWARLIARVLETGWLVGSVCVLIGMSLGVRGGGLIFIGVMLMILPGVGGALALAHIYRHVASEAELDEAARTLNLAFFLLPLAAVIGPVLAYLPARTMAVLVLPLIPWVAALALWCWALASLWRGVLALSLHARWAQVHAIETAGRPARIAAKQRKIDEAVQATIRPLPPPAGADVPVEPDVEADAPAEQS